MLSDNEIRQILIERKREERRMQREEALQQRKEEIKEEIMEAVKGILAWASLFGLGYMAFLGAYMIR